MAVSTDPKPVPVATATVPAGGEAVYAPLRPRLLRLAGRPALLAATVSGAETGGLALITHPNAGEAGASRRARRRSPARPSRSPASPIFRIRGASGRDGQRERRLQLWTLRPDTIEAAGDAAGYAAGAGDADLAVTNPAGGAPPELVLPVAGRPEIALVSAKGTLHERLRVTLPAPVTTGIVVLGEGNAARLLVGLADGHVAVIAPDGGTP